MNELIAQPSTIKKAIEACQNRRDISGRINPDRATIRILKGVLSNGFADQSLIEKHRAGKRTVVRKRQF